MLDIGEAVPDDRVETIALWTLCGLVRPWNNPDTDFSLAMDGATATIIQARDSGELVGTIMTGFDGHRGWAYYLAVTKERLGQGIGRALMGAAEDWLRAHGAPKIQLMVRDDNMSAIGFYDAIGYEKQPVFVMGRRLDQDDG